MTGVTDARDELARLAGEAGEQVAATSAALTHALSHAIAAGHALRRAKQLVPHGEWARWLGREFPDRHPKTLRTYMRLAEFERVVLEAQPHSIDAAAALLVDQPRRVLEAEMSERAKSLHAGGMAYNAIAAELGVSRHAVEVWCSPGTAARIRERREQTSRAARREAFKDKRQAAAHGAGEELGEAYDMVRGLLPSLQRVLEDTDDADAKRAVHAAMQQLRRADDHLSVAALCIIRAQGT